jgi:hypothetical protein
MRKSKLDRLYAKRQAMRSEHARMTNDQDIRAMQNRLDAITESIVRERRISGQY